MCFGQWVEEFNNGLEDICQLIGQTPDMCFRPRPQWVVERVTEPDGIVIQRDTWTYWFVGRPFDVVDGARCRLIQRITTLRQVAPDPVQARAGRRIEMFDLQARIGDAVICPHDVHPALCNVFSHIVMGLGLLSYLDVDYPELADEYLDMIRARCLRKIHAIVGTRLSAVVLIAEDSSSKQALLFNPEILRRRLYLGACAYAQAWHEHSVKALFHTDGNFETTMPDLIACGVDGFYCPEPGCGEGHRGSEDAGCRRTFEWAVWTEWTCWNATPEEIGAKDRRQILKTNALDNAGMFAGSSIGINPAVKPENFRAMVETVGEVRNPASSMMVGRETLCQRPACR